MYTEYFNDKDENYACTDITEVYTCFAQATAYVRISNDDKQPSIFNLFDKKEDEYRQKSYGWGRH